MGAIDGTNGDEHDAGTATLGDVLYADKAKTRISEAEWVALVRSIAAGDQYALRALYGRMHRLVFTLTMRIINDQESAEEVTLDVFHDVWKRAAQYQAEGGSVVGWVMNQARSRAIDRLRFENRKKRVGDDSVHAPEETPLPGPDAAADNQEQGRLLRDALAVLTPDERQAIELAYFSEFSYPQVAERLNAPLGTVKTRIRSGLGKIRQALTGAEKPR
jgi:RNA polymerase sigma-70 factor, ECF subfamily